MRSLLFLSVAVALCLSTCYATDLILGTSDNNTLIYQQNVKSKAVKSKITQREVSYYSPNRQIIKGVIARDLDHTKATVTVIGGVGYSRCYIRLRSEIGRGLNYEIEIYG